jgi:hypothetical protein
MESPNNIATPARWKPRRIRRFIIVGAIVGALIGLVFALIMVAAAEDWDWGAGWLWLLAIAVGGVGGGVIGLVAAGIGGSEEPL